MHLKIQIYDAGSRPAANPAILAYKMRGLAPLHAPGSMHRLSDKELRRFLLPNKGALFVANDTDTNLIVGAAVFGQIEPRRAHLVVTAIADGVDQRIVVPNLTREFCGYFARKQVALSLVTPRRDDIRQLELDL